LSTADDAASVATIRADVVARRATREALVRHAALPFHHFVFNGTLKGIERECKVFVKDPNTCPVPGEYARGMAAQTENAEE